MDLDHHHCSASVASKANIGTRVLRLRFSRAMSDSDQPSEATVRKQLQDIVISLHKAGNTDDLTVNRVRTRAEEALGLEAGFFNSSSDWKQKSKDTIKEAVVSACLWISLRSMPDKVHRRNTVSTNQSLSLSLSLHQKPSKQRHLRRKLLKRSRTRLAPNAKLQHRKRLHKSEGRLHRLRMNYQTSSQMQRASLQRSLLGKRRKW